MGSLFFGAIGAKMEHLSHFGVKFVCFELHGHLRIKFLAAWAFEWNFLVQKPKSLGPRHCFKSAWA